MLHLRWNRLNKRDRDNTRFLISADLTALAAWIDQATNEDIKYALELTNTVRSEIEIHEMDLQDEIEDFTEAKLLIDRIKNV